MKKILSLLTALITVAMYLASSVFAVGTLTFEDVAQDSWYYDDVARAWELKLMDGRSPSIFSPKTVMTRAEFVTLLAKTENAALDGMELLADRFTDVSADDSYAPYIGWAAENKLVTGYTDGTFLPNAPISRQELAVMLVRFMDLQCFAPSGDSSLISAFTDASSVGKWAREQLERLRAAGLVNGDENGCFNPQKYASRAECAAIAVRYHDAAEAFFNDFAPASLSISISLPTDRELNAELLNELLAEAIDSSSYTSVIFKDANELLAALDDAVGNTKLDCTLVFTRRNAVCEGTYSATFTFTDADADDGNEDATAPDGSDTDEGGSGDGDSGTTDSSDAGESGDLSDSRGDESYDASDKSDTSADDAGADDTSKDGAL